jgi:hypothetical protein
MEAQAQLYPNAIQSSLPVNPHSSLKRFSLYILLWAYWGISPGQAQTPLAKAAKLLENCGCNNLELSRFTENNYFSKLYGNFERSKLLKTFEINNSKNETAQKILADLSQVWPQKPNKNFLYAVETATKQISGLVVKGNFAQEIKSKKIFIVTEIQKNKPIEPWLVYATCEFAALLHAYYISYPEEAPGVQMEFYQKLNKSNSTEIPHFANSSAMNLRALTAQDFLPALLMGGFLLLIMLLLFFLGRKKGVNPDPKALLKEVLNSPELAALIEQQLNSKLSNVASQISTQLSNFQSQINDLRNQIQSAKSGGPAEDEQARRTLAELQSEVANIPRVDVRGLERLLTDMKKQVDELERTSVGVSMIKDKVEIKISPEMIVEWIGKSAEVRQSMQKALKVDVLQDTIMRLLPKRLEDADLDAIEQQTLDRYWRLYNLNPKYIPSLKQEIKKELGR